MHIGLSLALTQASGSTLTQRALAILRTYGTDAHLWLPGVGAPNGIEAANFIESIGTSAAAVDSPVGYVGDAGKTLGPELNPQPEFTAQGAWSLQQPTSGSVTISGGRLRVYSADGSNCGATLHGVLSAGKTYEFTMTVVNYVSGTGGVSLDGGTTNNFFVNANGTFTFRLTGAAAGSIIIKRFTACDFSIESFSVREIIGAIPATQSTTASKPILRQSGGRYSWQFDGADFLTLGSVPFQMADNFVVVAGASIDSTTSVPKCVFGIGSGGASNSLPFVGFNSSNRVAVYVQGGGTTLGAIGSAPVESVGVPLVISAKKTEASLVTRRNGAVQVSQTPSGTYTTGTTSAIGHNSRPTPSEFFTGPIYPVIAIKGTVSDADLLTLERWVGSLSGVTIP